MKDVNGIWLPDEEEHLNQYAEGHPYGKWGYQTHKLSAALEHVNGDRKALDIGGHCGLWSKELTKIFKEVIAFEPVEVHRECFNLNVTGNYKLIPYALGEKNGEVILAGSKDSSGDTWVRPSGDSDGVARNVAEMRVLDDFDFEEIDFLKIDCEGYELYALRGGEETLKRCKPVMVVEQKPGKAKRFGLKDTEAITYLKSLGAKVVKEISGDYIMVW